jgi:hypothetical protein
VDKLTGPEFAALYKALHGVFKLDDFDAMLQFMGRPRTDVVAGGTLSVPNIILMVMGDANKLGWILELIEAAAAFYPTYRNTLTPPAITDFIAAYPRLDPAAKPPPEPDPYETLVMRGGRVFIARNDLRQKLRVIGTGVFSRVLVVNGSKCSGKTYSWYFLNHIKERNGVQSEKVVYVDLDREVNKPEDFVTAIGRPLGLQTIPARTSEQDARGWVPAVSEWVRAGVQAKKQNEGIQTWWFILDGFADKTHESTIYDLILMLATRADLDMQELRLLLLNYGQRLGGQHMFVNEEKISEIGEQEVLGFLKEANRKAGSQVTDEKLKAETKAVFAQVAAGMAENTAPEQERLYYISMEVTRKARQLFPGWMP